MFSKMAFDKKMLEDDIKEARISDMIAEAVFVDYGVPKIKTKYNRPEVIIEFPDGRDRHIHTRLRGTGDIKYLSDGDGVKSEYEVC